MKVAAAAATTPPATAAPHANREFLPSLALIRAVAALMVVYDHLVGVWLHKNEVAWLPAVIADRWIFDPLRLMMHGGGLAVAMFFLVSGFVIVLVAQRESHWQFAVRRVMRIFPPLWASILLLLLVYAGMTLAGVSPSLGTHPVEQVLQLSNPWPSIAGAMSLVNYLLGTPIINSVAWTLAIEMLFYIAVALLLPLLRTRPHTALVVAFVALALLQVARSAHPALFRLAVNAVYVNFLFLGSLLYFRWAGRIGNWAFAVGTLAFWGLFLSGIATVVAQPPLQLADYGVSYAYAWLAFVVLLLLNDRMRLDRVTLFFSRISFSLYLNHGEIGLLLLSVLFPFLGYPMSLLVTFVLVVALSAASWRWVELPSQQLARTWTRSASA